MRYFLTGTLCLLSLSVYAQDSSSNTMLGIPQGNENKENTMLQLFYSSWLDVPDTVSLEGLSRGVNIYLMVDKAFMKSNFKFAIGLGLGMDNVFFDGFAGEINDSIRFYPYPDSLKFRSKLSTTHVDIPVELRFRTKPNLLGRSFKLAIGFKFGVLLSSYMKYKGDDPTDTSDNLKTKVYNLRHISSTRYGLTGRIGYADVSIFGYYALSTLFDKKGPQVKPFTLGLIFSFL